MKRTKIILIILAAALLTALTAFAVSSADDVMMMFDKGTEDDVSGMPETETIDGAYLVPDSIPEREGYEFLYWKLDYEAKTSYTVRYLELSTGQELAPSIEYSNVCAFDTVDENALEICGYVLVGDTYCEKVLSIYPKNNEICFYYEEAVPQTATYTVRYIDIDTTIRIADDKVVKSVYEGETVTEYAKTIYGYTPFDKKISWQVADGDVIIFAYYYSNYEDS